jgi:cob(I)alamin adenosyltransferase
MLLRALGYGQKVAVIQFIKGVQKSGEELFIEQHLPDVFFFQMNTGFTWDTQDREKDEIAAKNTWQKAVSVLTNPEYDLVILDELTYMLSFQYLEESDVINVIESRPSHQSVIVTGRGGGSKLRDLADTVSDVKDVKHAYNDGVAARQGVDF